ncbi:MAG: hypothetical protein HY651_04955 [Acidobacteria bacterium]|nr:hypothetical protein [Acidobacteriota bacterium]
MPIKPKKRENNREEALRLMLERLGDRAIYKDEDLNDDPAFSGIYPTTWQDLTDRQLVSARPGISWCYYQLAGDGWLEALRLSGSLDTPEFQDHFGRLNATLKGFISRHQEGFRQVHVVADKAGVSEGWLYNILKSRIWEQRQHRCGAYLDESETVAIIPIRFNMPLL